ncbi:uncharacterized protein A4U43_C03F1420 [Asparagus officinalis]|uniref:Pleiotropic ABC efflux transporter N-terminal domain-containing protein n=1 Tax=Asparagus officinalis TaxID=4686 RepID=A0A5P1F6F1_ASPOF|nr:uncharacterized protein A4U43_C03F1420 [Asparagus officinalis]
MRYWNDIYTRVADEDNEKFLYKLKGRINRVGIDIPTVEVRFENLDVEAGVYVVRSKSSNEFAPASMKLNNVVTRAMASESEKIGPSGLPIDLRGDNLQILRQELKSQRKHVKSLKKKSVGKEFRGVYSQVIEKLVDIVHFLHLEIHDAFGTAVSFSNFT